MAGLLLWNSRDPEPRYQGISVTDWTYEYTIAGLEGDQARQQEAELVVRKIGTNGLPFILEFIAEQPDVDRG